MVTVYFLVGRIYLIMSRGPEEALEVERGILFLPGLLDVPVAEVSTIDTTYSFTSYLQVFFFNLKQRIYTDKMSLKESHLQVRLNLCLSERIGPKSLLHCFLSR